MMMRDGFVSIPTADSYWLRRARVPAAFLLGDDKGARRDRDGAYDMDLRVERGRFAGLAPAGSATADAGATVDLAGRQLWPTLADAHTHIDKSQVIGRIGPLGASFANAREAINADRRKHWDLDDIRRRMEFSIRCAHAHGVGALRSHIDSYEGQAEASWQVFAEMRAAWKDRVVLQATASVPIDVLATDYGRRLADLAAATEGGLLGGVLRRSTDHAYIRIDNIDELLDAQFALAKERNLGIDLHVDETTDASVFHLPDVARAVIRHKMQGRVVCGHCCSLAVQPPDKIDAALALCAEAGIGIITLPLANLYLQDRALSRTPRLRGVTALHEIRAKNIPLAIGSDNVRDTFYPFGDYDPIDNFRQSVPLYHLDQSLGTSLTMLGPAPAQMMGLADRGLIGRGLRADFIVLDARSLNEVVCRPVARVVVRGGVALSEPPPAFVDSAGFAD
jgi:cytosine deaminase